MQEKRGGAGSQPLFLKVGGALLTRKMGWALLTSICSEGGRGSAH